MNRTYFLAASAALILWSVNRLTNGPRMLPILHSA